MIRRIYNHYWEKIKNILKESIYIFSLIVLFSLLFLCVLGLTIIPIIIGRLIHPIFYLIEIIAIPVIFFIIILMSQSHML